jgi:hypothetical protein
VPVAALRVPGVQDAVRDGRTGLLVDDEEHLADGIVDLLGRLADEAEARQWAVRARSWAGEFTWERTARQIRLVLEAEGARLALPGPDRRAAADIVTIVILAATSADIRQLRNGTRRTDSWSMRENKIVGLLHGADEIDALAVLQRLDVVPSHEVSVRLRIGRPQDLLVGA